MRASLNEIKEIEKYLSGQMTTEEALVFEARLITSPLLKMNTAIQNQIHIAIKVYQRKQLKEKLKLVHTQLFSDSGKAAYQQKVINLFNP